MKYAIIDTDRFTILKSFNTKRECRSWIMEGMFATEGAEQAKRAMEMAKDYAKKYDKRIFKLYNEIKSLCRTYDCYEVVVPKNSKEMLEEGVALHNCVGSMYAPRQASGDDVCLFLHKDGKPCVALRIDPRTYEVKECRFVCNENCGEKEWEIARDIAKRMAKLAA